MGEYYDADRAKAKKEALKQHTAAELAQNPNLIHGAMDDLQKKGTKERAQLKKKVELKELKEKLAKEQQVKKDPVMKGESKQTTEKMQKQAKEKDRAEKEQGKTEQPNQQMA